MPVQYSYYIVPSGKAEGIAPDAINAKWGAGLKRESENELKYCDSQTWGI
ncbi:MAG: hypothetical protein QME90_14005 [Thermodesulfobacteriota bacterium]|nr:hypothetical protein [Thermodesulfobacteriota bacterium]